MEGESDMKYWDEKFETMIVGERQKFQLEHLQKTVRWIYERVPHYKNKFDNTGVMPDDLRTLEDLVKFPFTDRTDLRDNYRQLPFRSVRGSYARGYKGPSILGHNGQTDNRALYQRGCRDVG
jgi:phenylacetate-CoA ligase